VRGREVGMEGCGRLCSELHDCYCSPHFIIIVIIWCEREVGIGGCGRFCSELHDCYSPPNVINLKKPNVNYS